ncbi:MAG TPA: SDR family NAD(P)-dependent oxidoreductase [Solirubrobacterales bacterium]
MIGDLLDRGMDFAVAPGYSVLGYRVRERSWDPIASRRLAGRRILVTGASSGIGEALCHSLHAAGAEVHMLARDAQRGEAARRRVLEAGGDGEVALWLCDVSDLEAIHRFAAAFSERMEALDGIVHNAGVLTAERERSAQGHELTFATHVLGPLLLTSLLQPALRRGNEADVVFVSSGGMYTARAELDDLELERRSFDGPRFYAHAKRLQVMLAGELARRQRGSGVSYSSLHPGWVDTPGLEASLPGFHRALRPFLRDTAQGADTALWLLAGGAAHARPGAFWHDRRPRPTHRLPWTHAGASAGRRLYAELASIAGIDAVPRMTLAPGAAR